MSLDRRTRTVNIHISPRDYALLAGLAEMTGKNLATLASDIVVAELLAIDNRIPGAMLRAAERLLERKEHNA